MNPKAFLTLAETRQEWMRTTLRDLVQQESPSENRAAINAAVDLVEAIGHDLGGRVRRHKQRAFGDILELRFGPARSNRKPILLLGHLDTVWPLGTLKNMPWREEKGRYYGPGVFDMKAGVVMALAAIGILKELKLSRTITLLLNSDEEVGSTVSRPITEKLAAASSAVIVLEPAQGLACKTARKGVGLYNVRVTGVAAHSGLDFERGHSAILELARLVQIISGFTDLSLGRTVNCGVIAGGTRSNVIAQNATVEVDVRIAKTSDAARVEKLFRSLKPFDPHCKLEITGGINRPPLERKSGTIALYQQARGLAAELGFDLPETSTGGGSDGNFTAALGIPTLDGMGAIGEGAHAAHEHVLIEQLAPRTALLTALLASID